MDWKLFKCYFVLIFLLRQYYKGLILVQLLKSDVLDYKGLFIDVLGKVVFVKKELEKWLSWYFDWEVMVLIFVICVYYEQLQVMSDQVQAEYW